MPTEWDIREQERLADYRTETTCAICGGRFDEEFPEYAMADRDIPELDIYNGQRFHEDCIRDVLTGLLGTFHEHSQMWG